MRKLFAFLLSSCFLSSCVTLNTLHYSISNKDGLGTPNNIFSVSYPNSVTLQYKASGSCLVTNDNDSTLYIDLGESYWIDENGMAEKIYSSQVISTTTSGTSGSTVNLGGIASVLGASPGIQTLANSTNVGSTGTTGTTITQYQDRYISIPPYSTVSISSRKLGRNEQFIKKNGHYDFKKQSGSQIISYTFSPNDSKWMMARNQFILDYIDVQTGKKGYVETDNQIARDEWNALGWLGGISAIIGGLALIIAEIAMIVEGAN